MLCYITSVIVVLYNICHVVLYNICHVMLYNMWHVVLSFLRIRKKLNVVFVVVLVRENKGLIILILSLAFTANRFDAFKSQPHYNL